LNPASPSDPPVYSLAFRKALRLVVLILIAVIFIVMLLHHKGFIDIEEFGIPENYLYYGGLGVILLGIVPAFFIWRCPGCGAYLGRKANPVRCNSCEAEFR
jgi:hypothetical protein